jgi:DNA-binding NtrC family response regulator
MTTARLNSIVGITDYDEGTNLSRYLLQHGWNAEHACSAEEVLLDVEEGGYGLVVIDEEMLEESTWTLPEYLEAIGPDIGAIVLIEPGSRIGEEVEGDACRFVQHPYTYESLRLAIESTVENMGAPNDEGFEEFAEVLEGENGCGDSEDLEFEDL